MLSDNVTTMTRQYSLYLLQRGRPEQKRSASLSSVASLREGEPRRGRRPRAADASDPSFGPV